MSADRGVEELRNLLLSAGFKSVIIPVEHLDRLMTRFADLREELDPGFYDQRLSFFEFGPSDALPSPRSIILTAARQPKIRLTFHHEGETFHAILPPTYSYGTDREIWSALAGYLLKLGHRAQDARVPVKTLAACSELAVYGRNNITYIDGWGSLFRLKAYVSDLPATENAFSEPGMLRECEECRACANRCPTGAIERDRFLIRAERCLTYLNESEDPFPDWVDPAWHSCIVGCMVCQEVCPANRELLDFEVMGPTFSEEETGAILERTPLDELPESTLETLRQVDLQDGYDVLPRNLGALIEAHSIRNGTSG
jgi:epoxyqueuosine reductase